MIRGRMVGRVLRAVTAIGLAVALVPVVAPGEVRTASASLIDGFTPNVPCDFTFNFWALTDDIAVDDRYDRDASPELLTGPLLTGIVTTEYSQGVLANDLTDGFTVRPLDPGREAAVAVPPQHAKSFTLNPNGSFTYVPVDGYYGADSFTYVAHKNNGPCSNIGVVTILPMNRVRTVDDSYQTTRDTPLEVGKFVCGFTCGLIDNDVFTNGNRLIRENTGIGRLGVTPLSGNAFSFPIPDGGSFRTQHGTVTAMASNGSFVYTPDTGFEGTDFFFYSTVGFGVSALQTSLGTHAVPTNERMSRVNITVGPPPTDTGPRGTADEFTTTEETPLLITSGDLRANDPAMNYVTSVGQMFFQGQTQIGTTHGRLDVSWISLVPGVPTSPQYVFAMTYTPNKDFEGVDYFSYAGRLGIPGDLSADIPVSIRVVGTDDPPTPQNDTAVTDEDTPITIDMAANDSDPDGDLVRTSAAEDPCTVNLCAPAGWLNERHGNWVVNGNGTVTYTPEANYVGAATFLYEIADQRGAKGYARVTVDVRQNDAMNDTYTTREDTQLVVPAPGVLANDEGAATSAEVVTPPTGALTLNPDGSFTYQPPADAYGLDSFTYRAGGELALVEIDVTPVSDPTSLTLNAGCTNSGPTAGGFIIICLPEWDDRQVDEGEAATIRGRIVDIDDSPGTLVVNWGDGSPTENLPYPCTGSACAVEIDQAQCWAGLLCMQDALYFTLTHVYTKGSPGGTSYRAAVTAIERDFGLFNTQVADVVVRSLATEPGAPTGASASVVDSGSLSVSFVAPASDGGSAITSYGVTCSSTTGSTGTASGVSSPIVVSGLTAGATYTCVVTASNSAGPGAESSPSSPVALVAVPGAPTDVAATVAGSTSLSVAFVAPTSDGGSPVTYSSTCSSPSGVSGSASGASSPITVSALTAGATYTCRVTASNVAGPGAESSPSSPVALVVVPGAPTDVAATVAGSTSLSVSFAAPSSDGGSAITSYGVTCSSPTAAAGSASGVSSPIVVSGLTAGAAYTCVVMASNSAGPGAESASSSPVALVVVPGAPTGVAATVAGTRSLAVSFVAPASAGGSAITSYGATCTSPTGATGSASGVSSPITVSALTAGATYTCRVTASNLVGPGPASSASSPVALVLGRPGAPTGATATLAGSARLSVAFTPPTSNGGSPVLGYLVTCTSPSGVSQIALGSASPITVTSLTAGATYTCRVRAFNLLGLGDASTATAPVRVLASPGAPTNVVATRTTAGTLSVTFRAPASNGGSPITSYLVECASSNGGVTRSAAGVSSPVTVSSLTSGATYTCRASATNVIGTSAWSERSGRVRVG